MRLWYYATFYIFALSFSTPIQQHNTMLFSIMILCGICRLLIVDLIADSYFVVHSICLLHDVVINLQLFDSPFSFHCILLAKDCIGSYLICRGRIRGISRKPQLPRSRSYLQRLKDSTHGKWTSWHQNQEIARPTMACFESLMKASHHALRLVRMSHMHTQKRF